MNALSYKVCKCCVQDPDSSALLKYTRQRRAQINADWHVAVYRQMYDVYRALTAKHAYSTQTRVRKKAGEYLAVQPHKESV